MNLLKISRSSWKILNDNYSLTNWVTNYKQIQVYKQKQLSKIAEQNLTPKYGKKMENCHSREYNSIRYKSFMIFLWMKLKPVWWAEKNQLQIWSQNTWVLVMVWLLISCIIYLWTTHFKSPSQAFLLNKWVWLG